MLVRTAARPTTECSAATICGSSVAVIRRPSIVPMVAPIADTLANWTSTAGGKPTAASEDRMPEPTPRIPNMFPCLAVACEPRPESDPGRKTQGQSETSVGSIGRYLCRACCLSSNPPVRGQPSLCLPQLGSHLQKRRLALRIASCTPEGRWDLAHMVPS